MCMCIILCGVDVIIFNAIERYVSCLMMVRVGAKVDGGRWMYVGSRVYCILVCFGYVRRNVCMMLCVFVYWCAYVHAYVRICMWCEHMCLLICMWWCRFGVDDGFGIMVVSNCSS